MWGDVASVLARKKSVCSVLFYGNVLKVLLEFGGMPVCKKSESRPGGISTERFYSILLMVRSGKDCINWNNRLSSPNLRVLMTMVTW